MAIITISHEIGAGGPEIGQQLAERLGYRYVDQDLVSNAAQKYGLLEEKLSHLDESKPSLFERFDSETRRYITVIQTALYDFAERDNVVLMGRGGQWLLRGIPHVLRVRVMAPFDVRVKRLAQKLAGPMGEQTNPRTVSELVRRDDSEKAGRMRYLYEVGITDPALYDIVVNTEKLQPTAVVGLLAGVVGQAEMAATAASSQLVADRSLASRVQVALATHPETRKYRISVEAHSGVVTLEGTAAMDEAMDVARGVDGVYDVQARQMTVPPIPPFVA
ncbi:MAG TPA: cytidylate kinase family protein [Candidatus Limnocylindria bacterium]|nr:cytidylate kinase family protein [Candidatus Limnocylindria bacterium]